MGVARQYNRFGHPYLGCPHKNDVPRTAAALHDRGIDLAELSFLLLQQIVTHLVYLQQQLLHASSFALR